MILTDTRNATIAKLTTLELPHELVGPIGPAPRYPLQPAEQWTVEFLVKSGLEFLPVVETAFEDVHFFCVNNQHWYECRPLWYGGEVEDENGVYVGFLLTIEVRFKEVL